MIKDLVSVIIPVCNQEKFVVAAIKSVLNQTHGSVEVLVVDDGSSDDTADIIEAEFENQITFIKQANLGPSAAINSGLKTARGEFISLLGGDDIAANDRCANQVALMAATNHDLLFSQPYLIDSDGSSLPKDVCPQFFEHTDLMATDLLNRLFYFGNYLCAPSVMFRRSVFEQLGGFHEGLIQLQDYDYWLRALSSGLSIKVYDQGGVYYRRHRDNLSSVNRLSAAKAEMGYILKRVIANGSPRTLRETFSDCLSPVIDLELPLSTLERNLLLMSHPSAESRILAVDEVLTRMETGDEFSEEKKAGFNLFSYLYNNAG